MNFSAICNSVGYSLRTLSLRASSGLPLISSSMNDFAFLTAIFVSGVPSDRRIDFPRTMKRIHQLSLLSARISRRALPPASNSCVCICQENTDGLWHVKNDVTGYVTGLCVRRSPPQSAAVTPKLSQIYLATRGEFKDLRRFQRRSGRSSAWSERLNGVRPAHLA